jgi:ribosome biogenesis GTPase / thiamine phosphate phosphatase
MAETATVLRVDRKRIVVDTDEGERLEVALRGRVHRARGRAKSAVVVGDRVEIERAGMAPGEGVIVAVGERQSVLLRPEAGGRWRNQVLVANADRAVLVFAYSDPEPNAGLVDRLLVACHAGNVPPLLVFNKSDLAEAGGPAQGLVELYGGLGYELVTTCADSGDGVERLAELVAQRSSVFAGPSGTGKSSLINRVMPGVELRTGEISTHTGKGQHTTTAAQLVRLADGGHVIDTPGIREFGVREIEPRELELNFPEFPVPAECRFLDCAHRAEPGCAVRAALASGGLHPSRYKSYLTLRSELDEEARRR